MELQKVGTGAELLVALKKDHAALETHFRRVLASFRSGELDLVRNAWLQMEADLRAHLCSEEEFMLPAFERSAPHEAAAVREQHEQIRKQLDALGIQLDLHTLSASAADVFLNTLREHANHEEVTLYQWAAQELSDENRRSVLDRLRAWRRPQSGTAEPKHAPT